MGLSDQKYMQYDLETKTFASSSQENIHAEQKPTQEELATKAGTQAHQLVGQID
jgi:hypothetical protein